MCSQRKKPCLNLQLPPVVTKFSVNKRPRVGISEKDRKCGEGGLEWAIGYIGRWNKPKDGRSRKSLVLACFVQLTLLGVELAEREQDSQCLPFTRNLLGKIVRKFKWTIFQAVSTVYFLLLPGIPHWKWGAAPSLFLMFAGVFRFVAYDFKRKSSFR